MNNKIEVKLDWFWVPMMLTLIVIQLVSLEVNLNRISVSLEKIAS